MRFTIALLLGALILFIWNAVSWMALPFHSQSLTNIPESSINIEDMRNQLVEDGVYHYPGMPTSMSTEAMSEIEKKLSAGPRITMMVYKSGPTTLWDPMMFLKSFIWNVCIVLLLLLIFKNHPFKSRMDVVLKCVMVGGIVALISDVGLLNWYMFPLDYTLVNIMDRLVSMGLLGLFLSYFTFKNYNHV